MLIKLWGEKSKRPSLSILWGSTLLQPALTQSWDWAEMENQWKMPWPIFVVDNSAILASDLIVKAYLSALKRPSQQFKSCRTKKKKRHTSKTHVGLRCNTTVKAVEVDVICGKGFKRHGWWWQLVWLLGNNFVICCPELSTQLVLPVLFIV